MKVKGKEIVASQGIRDLVAIEKSIALLESELQKVATPQQVAKWILELCEANNLRVDSQGNQYKTPDWNARKGGLEMVMAQLNLQSKNQPVQKVTGDTKILIQVIDSKPKDVEVKDESETV